MNSSHSYLSRFALLLAVALSLVSCGGGSSGGGSTPTATISGINPVGLVATGSNQTIILTGTNFSSGMTLTISGTGISPLDKTTSYNSSAGSLSASVAFTQIPTDRYVTVTLKSSTGTILDATVLGVAAVSKSLATDIQPIFDTHCTSCHNSSATGGLNLNTGTTSGSTSMFAQSSASGCSGRYRIQPGDPRQSGSVLIDKVSYGTVGGAACGGGAMPPSGGALTSQQLQDIIEWVAQGIPN